MNVSNERACTLLLIALVLPSCAGSESSPRSRLVRPTPNASVRAPVSAFVSAAPERSSLGPEPAPPPLDPDGNDEPVEADITLPDPARFEKVGRHWAALQRICDFAVHGEGLFMAHATAPLGLGGASITRYTPDANPPFSLSFDWNRHGEPERGGGSGQGFLRLRAIGDRLYVPDADPPYLGLGLASGIEGYLFESDARGKFAPARLPGHLPPRAPSTERGGAHVLPGSLHGFDVIRFRGRLYASASAAIPPNGSAPSWPGVLFTPGDAPGPWRVAFSYAGAPGESSVRLGYMTRFRDRLYVALSPLVGLDTHDFVVIAPPRERTQIEPGDARAVRVTQRGGAHTLRWYTDRGKLYWLTLGLLFVSEDGDRFEPLLLPADAGRPADILRVGASLLILAERGLYELIDGRFVVRAALGESLTPFKVDDAYCAPPLGVFGGALYAGGQRRGELYRLTPSP